MYVIFVILQIASSFFEAVDAKNLIPSLHGITLYVTYLIFQHLDDLIERYF